MICTGLFRGISYVNPLGATCTFVPGQGEIFEFPIYSFEPRLTGLGFEAIPGGAFEVLAKLRYEDNPRHVERTALKLLYQHAPTISVSSMDSVAQLLCRRQIHKERRALPRLAGIIDAPAVSLDNRFGDAQPQADPAILARGRAVGLSELTEDTRAKGSRHTRAMITDTDAQLPILARDRYFNRASGGRKLGRVGE